jgi:hypothetical protein
VRERPILRQRFDPQPVETVPGSRCDVAVGVRLAQAVAAGVVGVGDDGTQRVGRRHKAIEAVVDVSNLVAVRPALAGHVADQVVVPLGHHGADRLRHAIQVVDRADPAIEGVESVCGDVEQWIDLAHQVAHRVVLEVMHGAHRVPALDDAVELVIDEPADLVGRSVLPHLRDQVALAVVDEAGHPVFGREGGEPPVQGIVEVTRLAPQRVDLGQNVALAVVESLVDDGLRSQEASEPNAAIERVVVGLAHAGLESEIVRVA